VVEQDGARLKFNPLARIAPADRPPADGSVGTKAIIDVSRYP
jgi:hypothetical protein